MAGPGQVAGPGRGRARTPRPGLRAPRSRRRRRGFSANSSLWRPPAPLLRPGQRPPARAHLVPPRRGRRRRRARPNQRGPGGKRGPGQRPPAVPPPLPPEDAAAGSRPGCSRGAGACGGAEAVLRGRQGCRGGEGREEGAGRDAARAARPCHLQAQPGRPRPPLPLRPRARTARGEPGRGRAAPVALSLVGLAVSARRYLRPGTPAVPRVGLSAPPDSSCTLLRCTSLVAPAGALSPFVCVFLGH